MKFVLYEDSQFVNLLPLVYFRPVWELRCGAVTLEEKVKFLLNRECFYYARAYLREFYLSTEKIIRQWKENEEYLLINGRWLVDEADVAGIMNLKKNHALVDGNTVLAFRGEGKAVAACADVDGINDAAVLDTFAPIPTQGRVIRYLWDAISRNGEELKKDYHRLAEAGKIAGSVAEGVHLVNAEQISIARNAKIYPGVVINAEHGPVWIDEGATIMANAVLEGPLYVGRQSTVKIGAKIYENTTIGPVCKVGGEIEESIIHSYSNKQHDGFLGHAYLGSWVNLGADTNNSDLKNNYGFIKVMVNGYPVDTGLRFVGLMMGDHSKCAINTMFNTGTVVGVSCNIFGAGMPPRFVPSFSWGGSEALTLYQFEKAVEVAQTVMSRRNVEFTQRDEQLFRAVRDLAKRVEKGTLL